MPPSELEVVTTPSSQAMAEDGPAVAEDGPAVITAAKKRKPATATTKAKKAVAPKKAPRQRKTADKNPTVQAQAPSLNKTTTNSETVCVPSTPEAVPSSRNVVSPISISSPKGHADQNLATTIPPSAQPDKRPQSTQATQTDKPVSAFADDVEPAEFMSRLDTWVREYHQTLPAPKPAFPAALPTTSDALSSFAAQSKEDRMAAVDEMICECLKDPNFGKLVEDVEDSWKRIGLGF